jgi:hypothetical protein
MKKIDDVIQSLDNISQTVRLLADTIEKLGCDNLDGEDVSKIRDVYFEIQHSLDIIWPVINDSESGK